jgi:hypothetical protein
MLMREHVSGSARDALRLEDERMSNFQITGLDPGKFSDLFAKIDDELAALGARRYVVDETPGYPDRVEVLRLPLDHTRSMITE